MVDEVKVVKAPATAKRSTKKKITEPGKLKLPTARAIEEARKRRKQSLERGGDTPGHVYGLPKGWIGAVVDPELPEGRRARIDALWTAKGWVKLEGLHNVSGYPLGAIVYVKTAEDYEQSRQERAKRIEANRKAGLMY